MIKFRMVGQNLLPMNFVLLAFFSRIMSFNVDKQKNVRGCFYSINYL